MLSKNKTYELLRIVQRSNKEGHKYNLALVVVNSSNDSDLVRVVVSDEQVSKLEKMSSDVNFDLTRYFNVQYNTYQKSFVPKITI